MAFPVTVLPTQEKRSNNDATFLIFSVIRKDVYTCFEYARIRVYWCSSVISAS
jgi:hypothetical protein